MVEIITNDESKFAHIKILNLVHALSVLADAADFCVLPETLPVYEQWVKAHGKADPKDPNIIQGFTMSLNLLIAHIDEIHQNLHLITGTPMP
jgi:hypothetical protein